MGQQVFRAKIEGKTALLQHKMTEDALYALMGAKSSRKKDKEEQTPREIAEKHAYRNEDGTYYVPTEYITGALKHVASDYKQRSSAKKSLKSIIAGVVIPTHDRALLKTKDGKVIKHCEVDVRKATNHQKGAVAACRPRFDDWSVELDLTIDTDLVTAQTCLDMLNDAGKRAGIGSFRVQKSGSFGQFLVTKWEPIS